MSWTESRQSFWMVKPLSETSLVKPQLRLAVFISGHGSNLGVILTKAQRFQSIHVVSSNRDAYGLERARQAQCSFEVLGKPVNWQALDRSLKSQVVDVIFLAGFMKIIPADFIASWEGRIYNLHPSLLPAYKGLQAMERAYKDQQAMGVTIHRVVPEVDAGAVILQAVSVPQEHVSKMSFEQARTQTQALEHALVEQWVEWISR